MADRNYCTAGQDSQGRWHIACREPAMGSVGILQNMRYTREMSSPHDQHFDKCVAHIRRKGGTRWTTNVLP